jgi:hypothetical protein
VESFDFEAIELLRSAFQDGRECRLEEFFGLWSR